MEIIDGLICESNPDLFRRYFLVAPLWTWTYVDEKQKNKRWHTILQCKNYRTLHEQTCNTIDPPHILYSLNFVKNLPKKNIHKFIAVHQWFAMSTMKQKKANLKDFMSKNNSDEEFLPNAFSSIDHMDLYFYLKFCILFMVILM